MYAPQFYTARFDRVYASVSQNYCLHDNNERSTPWEVQVACQATGNEITCSTYIYFFVCTHFGLEWYAMKWRIATEFIPSYLFPGMSLNWLSWLLSPMLSVFILEYLNYTTLWFADSRSCGYHIRNLTHAVQGESVFLPRKNVKKKIFPIIVSPYVHAIYKWSLINLWLLTTLWSSGLSWGTFLECGKASEIRSHKCTRAQLKKEYCYTKVEQTVRRVSCPGSEWVGVRR